MRIFTLSAALSLSVFSLAAAAHDHHHGHHGHHDVTDYSAQFAEAKTTTQVRAEQCWVRLLPEHVPSAGYFVLHNDGDQAMNLLAAISPSYDDVMLHETIEQDGMAKMVMAEKMEIPAKGTLEFKPGGLHAMFEKPVAKLQVGDRMQVELLFDHAQKISMDCKVNPANARQFE